ncbi:tripartite tricarboxylate transporter substrate binding protein [Microbacterium sp.]|uniref:tripartite tricarboxylate transporter substrate binding protein n=1 Tax=Microbacterium sp. TaxID=51671 RepID=UPI0039E42AEC
MTSAVQTISLEPDGSGPPPKNPNSTGRKIARVVGGVVAVAAIGVASYGSISSAAAGSDIHSSMTLIAPAAAGGGWDGVAREMQQAMKANGIVNNVQVVNMPGAGGTIALGNLSMLTGEANNIMVGGTGLLAATVQYSSATTLADVTPLATIVEEYDVIVVPADSPYQTLEELVEAWTADPREMPWSGGGSFDQLVVTDLALSAGIDPVETTYIPSDGGGEAIQALLNGTVKAAAGGFPDNIDQIESGRLRALAVVAAERMEGVDIPTAREQGYDITLANWRMLMAPAGLTDEEVEGLSDLVAETLATPEWADAIKRYRWTEQVITGEELDAFLAGEQERIEKLYEEMGQ